MRKESVKMAAAVSALLIGLGFFCGSLNAEMTDNNVVIVLDASGSMNSAMGATSIIRMDAAKDALLHVVKDIGANTNIGLLVFSAENMAKDDWLYTLGPIDINQLKIAIRMPKPGYKTPLGQFIKVGADKLLEQRKKQYGYGTYRLIIVTDGEADDPKLVDKYVPEIIARGITIDAIGVDMAQTHTLATKVHSYREAKDPEALKQALSEVFAEIGDAGTDMAAEDAFDVIAAIPDEMAGAMLDALSNSGNHPIGEKPVIAIGLEPTPDESGAEQNQKEISAQPASEKPSGSKSSRTTEMIVLIIIALALILQSVSKKKKRKRN